MWVFYLISLPLTLGMVILTLRYFAGPEVPRYVLFTVGYTWFCSLSIIILVPADIYTAKFQLNNGGISFFWSWSYWSTFLLTWAVVPLIQGFEDAGDFTVTERLKTSIHANLVFYLIVGSIGLFGLILLVLTQKRSGSNVLGVAMACSNTFGLVTGAFLLGFGLSEIPKNLWRNADWTTRQKVLSHKIAKMAVKLDDAHQELSNAIVVAQATSTQMSKRDPLRPARSLIAAAASLFCVVQSERNSAIMLVYQDLLTGDELLSDSFPYKEIQNGMLWEVEGKWVVQGAVDVDIGANPSAEGADEDEGVDDQAVKVVDIVDTFRLQEQPSFDKKQFVTYMKRFIKLLTAKLDGEKQETFKKNIEAATKFLLSKLSDLQFFVGESMHDDGSLVFAYYKEGATDPTFLYFAYALKEVKC